MGIEYYSSGRGHIAVEVRRVRKADTSAGRCPPESGRVSLQSARRGESNTIGVEASTCLLHPVADNLTALAWGRQVQRFG